MASIQKRKDKYNVVYYYADKYGKQKQKWESFRTLREARKRKAEVELQQANRTFIAPSTTTLNDSGQHTWIYMDAINGQYLLWKRIRPYLQHIFLHI